MPDYQMFSVTVTVLTPLHIGNGRELLLDFDYAVRGGKTWRLNENEVLLPHYSEDPRQMAMLAQRPPAELLEAKDFVQGSPFFRYVIPGMPRAQSAGSVLREQIKGVDGLPYLPGSSLKGALRTVLAWYGWQAANLHPDKTTLDRRPKFAAQYYEDKIFGADPNHDLLRALQVSDSRPVTAQQMLLANVKVLSAKKDGAPIEVEAIRPETRFELTIKLDQRLFSDWSKTRDNFRLGGSKEWLEKLVDLARAHARQRATAMQTWFNRRPDAQNISKLYQDLANLAFERGQFILQLGWGGGWDSKTFGSHLSADAYFMDTIIQTYRLSKTPHSHGASFPASRRVAMKRFSSPNGAVREAPGVPMGWVLVDMQVRK